MQRIPSWHGWLTTQERSTQAITFTLKDRGPHAHGRECMETCGVSVALYYGTLCVLPYNAAVQRCIMEAFSPRSNV